MGCPYAAGGNADQQWNHRHHSAHDGESRGGIGAVEARLYKAVSQAGLAMLHARAARRLEGADLETHYDTALIAKDGSRLDVEFSVSVWKMPEYNGVICLVRDIRNQLAMQRKLRNMA